MNPGQPAFDPAIGLELAAAQEVAERERVAKQQGGNLLTEMEGLRSLEPAYKGRSAGAHGVLMLEMLRLSAELGNIAAAHRYADLLSGDEGPGPSPPEAAADSLSGLVPADALDFLAGEADRTQVMMINEAHHVPQHRAFTLTLLHALSAKGFRYFAAETLAEADGDLSRRGYPVDLSGPYASEPVYGDLIRTALHLGYRVVPYEALGAEDRELGQASNLVRRTLADDPGAKILVHAGYAHIDQAGTQAGKRPMARQFAEITGIVPLTIDQTVMTEHSAAAYEHPVYRAVAARGLERPTIFRTRTGSPWTLEPGKRTATIFHPRTRYEHGRPTWLLMNGLRRMYPLPAGICRGRLPCLVRARFAAESREAVPIDQVEITAGESSPALVLPDGIFIVEAESAAGTLLASFSLRMPPR
jgi:hypothetical protein